MAHGYVTKCFMTDDTVNHGSSHFIEVLFQTLEEVAAVCRQRNKPVPKHAVLQVDNTVSQAKNGIVAMILAWLVTTGIFVTLDLMLLLVGHTHEDIDQFFPPLQTDCERPWLVWDPNTASGRVAIQTSW
jgi:hypothetical protein